MPQLASRATSTTAAPAVPDATEQSAAADAPGALLPAVYRILPGALLQTIVELAEPEGATQLEVALDTAAPPPPAAGPAVFGADLAAIAALVG